jgi:hypothetical protein
VPTIIPVIAGHDISGQLRASPLIKIASMKLRESGDRCSASIGSTAGVLWDQCHGGADGACRSMFPGCCLPCFDRLNWAQLSWAAFAGVGTALIRAEPTGCDVCAVGKAMSAQGLYARSGDRVRPVSY